MAQVPRSLVRMVISVRGSVSVDVVGEKIEEVFIVTSQGPADSEEEDITRLVSEDGEVRVLVPVRINCLVIGEKRSGP